MLPHEPRRVSISSLRECTKDHKVVLIPPWTHYRSLFVSKFLANADEGLLYSHMRDGASLTAWLSSLSTEVRSILPEFGQHLSPLLNEGISDPALLGSALGSDLNRAASEALLLFIDDFDPRTWAEDAAPFLEALIEALGGGVKIVLSSRVQSYSPFDQIIVSGMAVILGIEWRRNSLHFIVETRSKPQLEIRALGKPETLVNGTEIKHWEGMLPKHLFYYLIDHPLVTRDQIFSAFWPKVSTNDATDIFHVTKHKVTEVLSRPIGGRPLELTQYTQGFYVPGTAYIRHYDVADFEGAVERAQTADTVHERDLHARTALNLYRGPYLEGVTTAWAIARREQLARLHAEALILMGRVHSEHHQTEEAARAYEEALKVLPLREDVERELIRCYLELGQVKEARKQLSNLEDRVYRKMEIKPTPATLELRTAVDAVSG